MVGVLSVVAVVGSYIHILIYLMAVLNLSVVNMFSSRNSVFGWIKGSLS